VSSALLFERHAVDEIDDWSEGVPRLGRSSMLWIDLEQPSEEDIRRLVEVLELTGLRTEKPVCGETPSLRDHGKYLDVTACAPADGTSGELAGVRCLVAEHWVVTIHEEPLQIIETFRERASGSGDTGRLEGPEFLASLLEWVLSTYFDAFERIELELEEIDATWMSGDAHSAEETLVRLVQVRRNVGRLRRALAAHRELILALARPELDAITSSRSAERFARLCSRLEDAVQAARDSRASVVGSFEVLIARTGQRTNEIMKVLTLASVLLLPGAVLAGIMGMNFKLGFFDETVYFWAVLVTIVAVALITLIVARVRHWI
jgi:magnesium transporter